MSGLLFFLSFKLMSKLFLGQKWFLASVLEFSAFRRIRVRCLVSEERFSREKSGKIFLRKFLGFFYMHLLVFPETTWFYQTGFG